MYAHDVKICKKIDEAEGPEPFHSAVDFLSSQAENENYYFQQRKNLSMIGAKSRDQMPNYRNKSQVFNEVCSTEPEIWATNV